MGSVLFEREALSPDGKRAVLSACFAEHARREGVRAELGHVPQAALAAYGDFNRHLRYILNALNARPHERSQAARIKKIERIADELPQAMMSSMCAEPQENWLCLCRSLLKLQELLEEADLRLDAEEYSALLHKSVQLVRSVSEASVVEVNAGSMFSLLLLQRQLYQDSARRRTSRSKRRKHNKKSPKPKRNAAKAAESEQQS